MEQSGLLQYCSFTNHGCSLDFLVFYRKDRHTDTCAQHFHNIFRDAEAVTEILIDKRRLYYNMSGFLK